MPNLCEGCPLTCCDNFIIDTEYFDPKKYNEIRALHPYIKRDQRPVKRFINGTIAKVHVHTCERYDKKTKTCNNHETEQLPEFCVKTGEVGLPHPRCTYAKTI